MSSPAPERLLSAFYDLLDFHSQLKDADDDKVWSRVLEKLAVVLDAEAATYFAFLPAKNHLLPRYALGGGADAVMNTAIDVRTGICGWTARHREPALVADAYKDERFFKDVDSVSRVETRTVMTVPLLDRLDLTGVIEFINKRSGAFSAEDLRFALAASRATSTALRALRMESAVDRITSHNASILENLSGGFVAMDVRGRLMLCNPAARRMLALGEAVAPGTPAEQVLSHVPRLIEILTETISSRQVVKRQEFQWKFQGETKTLGYSTLLIQDPQGNLSGAGITFQDITALKP